ncbi:hypothetical protein SERLA73DRAFT_120739 [Serpula lacrymans var. lacrymans S7.3]|uniref:Uncharacterized protein n=1 Tax=Serpula lacrymans var. lacrymans (strain S7.3) TaxID=936435 RepID=F8PPP4_SERL3|nr:hypothetical protein SERLA73DRAFT_120739 [Serpula lacrymans var. lacrymans S7.3]
MGKWTVGYHDEVLRAKMKSLVSGAIKRSKLENAEPWISYDTFVEELDSGDSFTTSIIDILVKELAERHFRHNEADRGLIADRTALSLKRLSNPVRVYGARSDWRGVVGRRGVDLTEYLSAPPDQDEMDEDDEDVNVSYEPANGGILEGARINSELHPVGRVSQTRIL